MHLNRDLSTAYRMQLHRVCQTDGTIGIAQEYYPDSP